jgi:hypothetical protein
MVNKLFIRLIIVELIYEMLRKWYVKFLNVHHHQLWLNNSGGWFTKLKAALEKAAYSRNIEFA